MTERVIYQRQEECCDFCLDPDPDWSYPCESFTIDGTNVGSRGDWAACEDCSDLIEDDDRIQLLARASRGAGNSDPGQLEKMFLMQDLFFKYRCGPRYPAEEYQGPTAQIVVDDERS